MSPTRIRRTVVAILLTTAWLVGSSAIAAGPDVAIVDNGYVPTTLTVAQHTVVIWRNTGKTDHTVTADDGSFGSDPLAPGDQFGNVFDVAGIYTYHCAIHPTRMKGTIIVTAVAPTPVSSAPTPPSGTLPPDFNTPVPAPTATLPPASAAPTAAVGQTPPASPAGSPGGSSDSGATTAGAGQLVGLVGLVGLVCLLVIVVVLARRRGARRT